MRPPIPPAACASRPAVAAVAALVFACFGTGAALAAPADVVAAGRQKFAPCATCHGSDGRSTVVPQYPKIAGQSAPYVVNALKAYRDGRRLGTFASMMAAAAKPLSDTDIENLAAYIESLDAASLDAAK
jgi:cytochrome c553